MQKKGNLTVEAEGIERDNYMSVATVDAAQAAAFFFVKEPFRVVDTGPDQRPRYAGLNVRIFHVYATAAAWEKEHRARMGDLLTRWRDAADRSEGAHLEQAAYLEGQAAAYNSCAARLEDALKKLGALD